MRPYIVAILIAALGAACGPRCLRDHAEVKHVKAACYLTPLQIGDVLVLMDDCVAAHDVSVTVCDQYEVERVE